MTRHRPTRRHNASKTALIARLHRGLRPKMVPDQVLDLGLVHANNLDLIATGAAGEGVLRDFVGSVLTWSKVAELLDLGVAEMLPQVELARRMVERYGRTRGPDGIGRVGFDGPDYQIAKAGLQVMDQLARVVDRPTAIQAADWSEKRLEQMAAAGELLLQAREAHKSVA